jgi:sporulation protein YabP
VLKLDQYPIDQAGTHKVEILQRESIRLTGVVHVESFDERQVVVETEMGMLALMGEEFHITALDLEKGQMILEGMLFSLEYSAPNRGSRREGSFLQRLFR